MKTLPVLVVVTCFFCVVLGSFFSPDELFFQLFKGVYLSFNQELSIFLLMVFLGLRTVQRSKLHSPILNFFYIVYLASGSTIIVLVAFFSIARTLVEPLEIFGVFGEILGAMAFALAVKKSLVRI